MPTITSDKVKQGAKFSRVSYGEVVSVSFSSVTVRNETGLTWDITRQIFDKEFVLANVVESETTCNQTELIQTIKSNQRVVMTVNFNKQPKDRDVYTAIKEVIDEAADSGQAPKPAAVKKVIREATTGPERTMIGRHYGAEGDRGRLFFHDMEATSGPPTRTVDPRTVNWAIINGVKYIVSS